MMLWLSPAGDDEFGDGSIHHPYRSVEHALELTVRGDEIVLTPGSYTGLLDAVTHGVKITSAGLGPVFIDGTPITWDQATQPALG